MSRPSIKQHLAALKMLFDWLVIGQVIPFNPAQNVRIPKHSLKKGKTPVLNPEGARALLDSIEADTRIGLRDRALIAVMVFTFARVGATVTMKVEDCYSQGRRLWILLLKKAAGGMRCRRTIIWMNIWKLISKRPACGLPPNRRCSAP